MYRVSLTAVTTALVLGAGCASGDGWGLSAIATSSVPATSTTTTTSPTTTTTTPPELSRQEAAQRYLAIVEPYNVALEGLEQAVNRGQPIPSLRAAAQATAAANEAHMRELQATVWPTGVQPAIDELLAESAQAQDDWLRAAQAPTRDDLVGAVIAAAEHDGSDAASTIRNLLGLPQYDEGDYA